jgi:arylsulfatase A-like enzyme
MNLVVIPLEGVSQTLLWQYREAMPTVWRLASQSISFRRFYSASTSAFQSFCDFIHGDSSELDHNLAYPSGEGCLLGRAGNLFGLLAEQGYAALGIQHGESCPDYVKGGYFGAWPRAAGDFRWRGEYDAFYAESLDFLRRAGAARQPFALYCGDRAGTVSDNCREKRDGRLFHQRFERGFSLLDQSVRRIMAGLESLALLDSTLVVLYGPYGMDPWKHGIFTGRTHAIEPYADVCWTPLFLYCHGRDGQTVEGLASSIDLKATILGILFPGRDFAQGQTRFSGINLLTSGRNIAFTQNLFALERENTGPALGLVKSYAATDGDLRLIVSSDGGIAGNGGMEFYYDVRDPGNTRNLLDFFNLDQNGNMTSFGRSDVIHVHFTQSFKPHLVRGMAASYNGMRDILKQLTKAKEEEALKHAAGRSESLLFHESQFNLKRRRR